MTETIEKPLLDTLIENRQLQILKTAVPYMPENQQRKLSMLIKLIEFQKTALLFDESSSGFSRELHACACVSDGERISKMLGAIRRFCTEKEQESIDMILNFYEMSASCDGFFSQ